MDTNKWGRHLICQECGCLNPPFGRGHSGRISKKECVNPNCDFKFFKKKKENYEREDLILEKGYEPGPHHAPGYIGEDLHRFHFSRDPRLIKYYGDSIDENSFFKYSFVGWKDPTIYEGEKILVRKVSSGNLPQVMVSKDFLVGNQQIYFFKKREQFKKISIYFYLAILTSRLIHYYYLKEFGDPDKDVMPHFTQSNLKKLPIPEPDIENSTYKALIQVTKKILRLVQIYRAENNGKALLLQKIQQNFTHLDELVFEYYGIHESEYKDRIVKVANQNGFKAL
jgi:hypothetical protein